MQGRRIRNKGCKWKRVGAAMLCMGLGMIFASGCGKTNEPETTAYTTENIPDADVTETDLPASVTDGETEISPTTADGTETQEEVPTETVVETEEAVLGELPESYTIEIDGQVLQFPMTYREMCEAGFDYLGKSNSKVPANTYVLSDYFRCNENNYICYIMNFDIGEHPLSACYVVGIFFDDGSITNTASEILLPGGITYGLAGISEIETVYGMPDRTGTTDAGNPVYYYEQDSYSVVTLTFDGETELLTDVDMKHFIIPDDFEESEFGEIEPDIIYTYNRPSQLSGSLFDYTLSYDGACYTLPAPVSEFVENGWTINREESEEIIPGGSFGLLYLEKDGVEFHANVRNYSNDAVKIDYCYITSLNAGPSCDTDMELAGEIRIGMEEAALEEVLLTFDGLQYEKEEDGDEIIYRIEDPDDMTCGYTIVVTGGVITEIDAANEPSVNDYREEKGMEDYE